MSTDPKPPKPMPSAEEINAYVEASAARTKLRLPLAKGSALGATRPSTTAPKVTDKSAQRTLPVSSAKKLPTGPEAAGVAEGARGTPQGNLEKGNLEKGNLETSAEPWRPFSNDDER